MIDHDFRFAAALALGFGALMLSACDKSPPPSPAPETPQATGTPAQENKPPPQPAGGTVQISGSSALQPLVNAAKEKFEEKHKGASIEVSAGGSKKGLSDVAGGAVQIGDSDIFAGEDGKTQLVDHRVAVVGFAAMANKGDFNAKVPAFSMPELAKIFSGDTKNWKDVGGTAQSIVVINRSPNSGTRAVFGSVVLGGDKFVESQTEDNSGALVLKLKQTKGSISYLALSFADPDLQVFGLKTDAGVVNATSESITAGTYPIWSYEHMYTKGEPTGLAKEFLAYMMSSEFQEEVLPKVPGFIPVTKMKVSRDKD
ncbi:MAG: phosphate ABC transporter substrate-binding protein [Polyangiaceae bacterium]|nr:phosphate ABC transporter substrate-binding protein [Polyangiaceae bacterium]